jgi:hypothetical protein
MRRPVWLAAGVALGVGGTLWAEQRVRRGVRQAVAKLSPDQMAAGARDSVRLLGDRVRGAVDAGRAEAARREDELWDELEGRRAPTPLRPTTAARPTTTARPASARRPARRAPSGSGMWEGRGEHR